ncbi:MAG: hypothetical protein AAB374_00705 [Patescibacteria group bacterium]
MTNRKFVLSMLVGFLLAGLIIIIGVALTTADGDGITDNKVYVINATYEVDDGAARQFDFKDRNVAKGSITVLTKHGGIRTVVFDPKLPPSTVVKQHVYVPEKVREGTVQPAYNYIEWRWNAAVLEVQRTTPTVISRK